MDRPGFKLAISAAALLGLVASGCIYRSSEDLKLGGTALLPAIDPAYEPAEDGAGRPLTSLDRSQWPARTIVAPVEVALTLPGAATVTPIEPVADRRRGVYPSPLAAIMMDQGSFERALAEGVQPTLRAAWEFGTLPARYLADGGGAAAYQRTSRVRRLTGPASPSPKHE